MKFRYYSDMYLKFGKNEWKNSTYIKNKGIVEKRLFYFFDYEIEKIKVSDIKIWLNLIDDVSNKSKKHYLNSLNNIFNLALEDEVILKNPMNYLKKLHHQTPKIEPFNDDEVINILNLSKSYNLNFQCFLYLGFFTGMRTGEILALKVKDIDFKNKTISINATRSRFGEGSPKTIYSIRKIPIINVLYEFLLNFIKTKNPNLYLLETQYHKPYRDCHIFQGFWSEILSNLNIKYRRPYTMRHTYATSILNQNLLTPLKLAKFLGHSNPKMIYDVYVNYLNSNLKDFNRDLNLYKP